MRIVENMTGLIGQTPLLLCGRLMKREESEAKILAKLEFLNPTGGMADRMAKAVIDDGIRQGRLGTGNVIIQATRGEMGVGIASQAAFHGFPAIIVMPDNVSQEYRTIIRTYGAQIVLTEAEKGIEGAMERARDIAQALPGSFLSFQCELTENGLTPQDCVGPEIWEDTGGQIDIVVGAMETGGSLQEVCGFLKSRRKELRTVGVKLAEESVLGTPEKPGSRTVWEYGTDRLPQPEIVFQPDSPYDEQWRVDPDRAARRIRILGRTEGILVGMMSGAVMETAVEISRKEENREKTVVAILPDSADRYYSTNMLVEI